MIDTPPRDARQIESSPNAVWLVDARTLAKAQALSGMNAKPNTDIGDPVDPLGAAWMGDVWDPKTHNP